MALTAALVALVLVLACTAAARRARRPGVRRAWLAATAASATALVWLLAAAMVIRPVWPVRYTTPDGASELLPFVPDPDLGYALRAGARIRAVRSSPHGPVFDATYTIGDDALRVTPGDPAGPAIVFFGCSYTFGEGVADDETLPARVSAALGGASHVENRAATGWGPHQMLRALETGRAPIAPGTRVFYQAIGDHVRRLAGKTPWDDAGPRYALDGDGVRFTGPLHSPLSVPLRHLGSRLVKYGILPLRVFGYDTTDDERELFVRIVAAAAQRVQRASASFTVIFWDDTPADAELAERLESRGVEVWRVSELLPGVDRGALMIAGDTHPGPELYRRLGSAIAARLSSPPDRRTAPPARD